MSQRSALSLKKVDSQFDSHGDGLRGRKCSDFLLNSGGVLGDGSGAPTVVIARGDSQSSQKALSLELL